MDRVDRLLAAVRQTVVQLLASSGRHLASGADLDRIQGHYVAGALRALEDAEAYAVLASAGDSTALTAIEAVLATLESLHDELDAEFGEPD
jgi:hypothetical protein